MPPGTAAFFGNRWKRHNPAEKTQVPEKTSGSSPAPDLGHFSHPESFEGFDAYQEWNGEETRLGETLFSDEIYGIQKIRQLNYGGHEMIKDAETLEPGAIGLVTTDYSTKTGGSDFMWRDEEEKHILRIHIYGEGDSLEISG